jgi:hypothetical protein
MQRLDRLDVYLTAGPCKVTARKLQTHSQRLHSHAGAGCSFEFCIKITKRVREEIDFSTNIRFLSNSSGVYIYKSIVNDLRHGNTMLSAGFGQVR